jgi:hypothetical protein
MLLSNGYLDFMRVKSSEASILIVNFSKETLSKKEIVNMSKKWMNIIVMGNQDEPRIKFKVDKV